MSRLNRAFIKAFEREPGTNASTAVLDRFAPEPVHASPPAESFDQDVQAAEPPHASLITRFEQAQLCLPRIVADVSLPNDFRMQEPYPSQVTSSSTGESGIAEAAEPREPAETTSADSTEQTWTPPFVYDGPTDWRSFVSSSPEPSQPSLDVAADPILPRDFLSSGESFRIDPSHLPTRLVNQPAADLAAAVDDALTTTANEVWAPPHTESLQDAAFPGNPAGQGLNEPALQVDRFAWPSVCLSLLERADAPFAGLVDDLFAGVSENRKLLAVSGYRRSAGRTTFLLSTARALAARGARVVVVDADWDTPHLAERLGVSPEVGWQDVLTGGLPLEETLIESLIDGVTLLPARPNRSRTRSINFALAQRNLELLREAYDFVLIDAGRLDDASEGKIGSMLLERMPIEGVLLVHDVSTSSLVNPSITERRLAQMQIRWWRVVENFVRPSK